MTYRYHKSDTLKTSVEKQIEVSFSRDELDVFGKTYKARYLDASFVSCDKVTKSIF